MHAADASTRRAVAVALFNGGLTMSYTLKRSINGLSLDDIKRIYDQNPNMTLRELSNLTGYAIPFLKKLLMEG
jgi:hypothetical protein